MATPTAGEEARRESLWRSFPRRVDVPIVLLASATLLVAGLALPVLYVEKLWIFTHQVSMADAITTLFRAGSIPLAVVLLVFSVLFPAVKLAILSWIWLARLTAEDRGRWLHRLKSVGKWSMLDVYVVATLVVAIKLGALARAEPRAGVYVFATSILLSMLATHQIDRMAERLAAVADAPAA